jgi:Flp pilus assembly protein TadD
VFVRHPDVAVENRSVGQFEQMEQSRCFTAARRPMVCTTCHDPHAVPDRAERDAHYRGKCLTCHAERGCALPAPERQAKGDSCIACHMPKAGSANIIHASVTDHRIPRTPARQAAPKGLAPGTPPLVRFRTGPHSLAREEGERDLGLALAGFAKKLSSEAGISPGEVRALAALRLRDAVERRPGDVEVWTALAGLREDRDSGAEQLRAARNAIALAPESDAARAALVEAATAAGRYDEAEAAATERIRLNPGATDPLLSRAVVRVGRGDWERAEADCRACLRLHPLHPQARVYLAVCLYKRGDRTAAEREHQTAVRLEPDPREQAHLTQLFRRGTQ